MPFKRGVMRSVLDKKRKIGTLHDIVGREIKVGDVLIYPDYYGKLLILYFCVCDRIENGYVTLSKYNYTTGYWLRFTPETPNRLFIIDIPENETVESLQSNATDIPKEIKEKYDPYKE
jgi:hypothetical protein